MDELELTNFQQVEKLLNHRFLLVPCRNDGMIGFLDTLYEAVCIWACSPNGTSTHLVEPCTRDHSVAMILSIICVQISSVDIAVLVSTTKADFLSGAKAINERYPPELPVCE